MMLFDFRKIWKGILLILATGLGAGFLYSSAFVFSGALFSDESVESYVDRNIERLSEMRSVSEFIYKYRESNQQFPPESLLQSDDSLCSRRMFYLRPTDMVNKINYEFQGRLHEFEFAPIPDDSFAVGCLLGNHSGFWNEFYAPWLDDVTFATTPDQFRKGYSRDRYVIALILILLGVIFLFFPARYMKNRVSRRPTP